MRSVLKLTPQQRRELFDIDAKVAAGRDPDKDRHDPAPEQEQEQILPSLGQGQGL